MRLVPDQDPFEIAGLFEEYLRSCAPPTVEVECRTLGTAKPALTDYEAPAIRAADRAYERAFGSKPVYMRGGGTLPVVSDFQEVLGVPVVMMGLGLPDDNVHAPNERFHLPTFFRGIEALIHYYSLFANTDSEAS
jgi:acetylornithine deacetylase/succinyl-diaminopimelate desuccinylase-like protein